MERRKTQGTLRTLGCGAALGGGSPSGVPPRLFPRGVWSLGAIRARFRGQTVESGGGHSADGRPTSSDAPRMPVVMPADMMPGPPGSGLQARPRAPPLAPPPQFASTAASFTGEMIRGLISNSVTIVNRYVTGDYSSG